MTVIIVSGHGFPVACVSVEKREKELLFFLFIIIIIELNLKLRVIMQPKFKIKSQIPIVFEISKGNTKIQPV